MSGEKDQYNELAALYDAIEELPQSLLYRDMVESALGDCTGKTVLDLGGGVGLHARKAIDLGAKLVDVVDVSTGMLDYGKGEDAKFGHEGRIRWLAGDISKPLDDLPLEKSYDITMVNWTFDHAETIDELETMWRNTSVYTKPGGKLISIRMTDPKATKSGKYGVSFSDVQEIAGGLSYKWTAHIEPPLTCAATTMIDIMILEQAKLLARRYDFAEFKMVVADDMAVVRKDLEFWKDYLDDPHFTCITAVKVES